ncbi:hypothetical protein cce_4993 [Crocosphaera subtropica ATCC 51142]|uniref:Uncharacterized protein n=1 Tax=Crocosphaera subtropica (strain ATCC 51142 / BH68) TaxID=43989 RepID=B1X2H8_CROS5|nr:hypothetical protein [Crocosphaera subtropica]ACB54339.1 hypothetical protein cce_4993 [Crocosphaera subtropica ATCC 51142]
MLNDHNAARAADATKEMEVATAALMLESIKRLTGTVADLAKQVQEMREAQKQKESQQEMPDSQKESQQSPTTAPTTENRQPLPNLEKKSDPTPNKVEESVAVPQPQQPNTEQLYEMVAELTKEVRELKAGKDVETPAKEETPVFSMDEQKPVSVLTAVENTLTDESRINDSDVRLQFKGTTSLLDKAKEMAQSLRTKISEGIASITGNDRSLATDLDRQFTLTQFTNSLLDKGGVQQTDGSTRMKGTSYEFKRDKEGGISIRDTKGDRGEVFSLKNGVMEDKLTKKDLKNFAEAAKVIKQRGQTKSAGLQR